MCRARSGWPRPGSLHTGRPPRNTHRVDVEPLHPLFAPDICSDVAAAGRIRSNRAADSSQAVQPSTEAAIQRTAQQARGVARSAASTRQVLVAQMCPVVDNSSNRRRTPRKEFSTGISLIVESDISYRIILLSAGRTNIRCCTPSAVRLPPRVRHSVLQ